MSGEALAVALSDRSAPEKSIPFRGALARLVPQPAADRVAYFTKDGVEYEAFRDPLNPQVVNWNNSARSYAQGHAATISPYLRKHDETPAGSVSTKLPSLNQAPKSWVARPY